MSTRDAWCTRSYVKTLKYFMHLALSPAGANLHFFFSVCAECPRLYLATVIPNFPINLLANCMVEDGQR